MTTDPNSEIRRLERLLEEARFADELREALRQGAATAVLAEPVTHSRLLEIIVETAAGVISAKAASLFLIDQQTDELVFEVALGEKASEVKKFRVPLGQGIAGLVAITGQPMAIADAEHNPQQAADIAASVGYVPHSILCVPLYHGGRVIGVLELLDKQGADTFNQDDMNVLARFAEQAAIAIDQSRLHADLAEMLATAVGAVAGVPEAQRVRLVERARAFASSVSTDDPAHQRSLRLATLVRRIASQGEDATQACERILQGFAGYLETRSGPGGEEFL